MKAVFVGGGAHRLLGIIRGAMARPGVLTGGEVNLYDLNVPRAEALGRMLMKSPEYRACGCKVTWGTTLEAALEGADAVGVVLFASPQQAYRRSERACRQHGFLASDNVSPCGAMLGVAGGRIIMPLARKMEQLCPNAILLDFANPVAVHAGMVNNHTRIKALGVCQGYTNHFWDLARVLNGKDEEDTGFEVEAAGINHLSMIVRGSYHGQDIFELFRQRVTPDWRAPQLGDWWNETSRANITNSCNRIVQFWRQLGVLIFSTEGDGMAHLMHDEEVAAAKRPLPSLAEIDASIQQGAAGRAEADRKFQSWLDQDLDQKFWDEHWRQDLNFKRHDHDIFVRLLTAIAGVEPARVAASRPSYGAVAGLKDRSTCEYSLVVSGKDIRPAGRYEIPDVVNGMLGALAIHQTMLGDAIATEDPRLLAHALLAYPIKTYSAEARSLYRELIQINRDNMAPALAQAGEYL